MTIGGFFAVILVLMLLCYLYDVHAGFPSSLGSLLFVGGCICGLIIAYGVVAYSRSARAMQSVLAAAGYVARPYHLEINALARLTRLGEVSVFVLAVAFMLVVGLTALSRGGGQFVGAGLALITFGMALGVGFMYCFAVRARDGSLA